MDTGNLVFIAAALSIALALTYSMGVDAGRKKNPPAFKPNPNRDKTKPITDAEAEAFIAEMDKTFVEFWQSGKSSDEAVAAVGSLASAMIGKSFAVAAEHAISFGSQDKFADYMTKFEHGFEFVANKNLEKTTLPVRITCTGPGGDRQQIQDILNQLLEGAKNETPKGPIN